MSFVPTAGGSVLVDTPESAPRKFGALAKSTVSPGTALTSWCVGKAGPWELQRDRGYKNRWGQYWRMWRGMWTQNDKNRDSERSRIVGPQLAQAIEMTVAELEEAVFSKDVWFDLTDDVRDEDKLDQLLVRDNLREDLDNVNAKDAVGEAMLNGAIFGTGIVKMNVEVVREVVPEREGATKTLKAQANDVVRVNWESIRPDEFIPDPAGRHINEMLGCFHKVQKPLHYVLDKIEQNVYRRDALPFLGGGYRGSDVVIDPSDPQAMLQPNEGEEVEILEYHGKVPVSLLHSAINERVGRDIEGNVTITNVSGSPVDAILAQDMGEESMVEAIVTIANGSTLLRAMVNPFTMQDRSVIAFQFEKVPGRFWGRGVAEKGFNPQKALDAEMRARIDALGFISSPMVAVDGGRVPRGFKMEIKPGKTWITQGPPKEVLQAVEIGQLNPNTFNQTQELTQMVQMATGAFDTASQMKGQGSQQNGPSASNVSMMMGAFVKRAKRAIRNVNDNLLCPLIKQTTWRYMQFAPRRYPNDFEFRVMATMGIMAKEIEAAQLTQTMAMLPDEFPAVNVEVAKGIIDLSSLHNKVDVMRAMEAATAPPTPEQQERQQQIEELQFTAVQADTEAKLVQNQKTLAETRKILAQALEIQQGMDLNDDKVRIEVERLKNEIEQIDILREQNRIALERVQIEKIRVQNEARRAESGE